MEKEGGVEVKKEGKKNGGGREKGKKSTNPGLNH